MAIVLTRAALCAAALTMLAACGGGGGGSSPTLPVSPKQSFVQKTVTINVPGYNKAKSLRSQYVSRNTQGIGISFGASPFTFPANTMPTAMFDVSLGSANCTTTNSTTGARTCTLTVGAPVGTDDFQVTAWDAKPNVTTGFAGATELSTVSALGQTIAAGVNTPLNLTLNGIVSSVNTSVSPSSFAAFATGGAPKTATVSVNALDADGNIIMDSGSNWIDSNGSVLTISVTPCSTANGGPITPMSPTAATSVTPANPTFTETYSGGPTWGVAFPVTIAGTTLSIPRGTPATLSVTPTVTLFPIPTAGSQPNSLTLGPDNNVWFTEAGGANVGFITQTGSITEVSLIAAGFFPKSVPTGIATVGGVVYWLDASSGEKIEWITPPSISPSSIGNNSLSPQWVMNQMIVGPDGNLWFTQDMTVAPMPGVGTGGVQYFSPGVSGSNTSSGPASTSLPGGITVGPDHNVWFTVTGAGTIQYAQFSGTGPYTFANTYSAPFPVTGSSPQPFGIATGADGNLWFTAKSGQYVGVMNTSGVQTQTYPVPQALGQPGYIIPGTDHAMWFAGRGPTNPGNGGIGRVSLSGAMSSYFTGLGSADDPLNLVVGGDGNIWFTEPTANKIGRLIY